MNRIDEVLDTVDRKLVAMLRRDARRPTAALARDLNLSRTAVQARIARLERDGIILGYHATVASGTLSEVRALVTLTIEIRPCDLVTRVLGAWPEVDHIYAIAGNRDAVLVVSVTSPQALSALADRLRTVEGVGAVETTVILSERTSAGKIASLPLRHGSSSHASGE